MSTMYSYVTCLRRWTRRVLVSILREPIYAAWKRTDTHTHKKPHTKTMRNLRSKQVDGVRIVLSHDTFCGPICARPLPPCGPHSPTAGALCFISFHLLNNYLSIRVMLANLDSALERCRQQASDPRIHGIAKVVVWLLCVMFAAQQVSNKTEDACSTTREDVRFGRCRWRLKHIPAGCSGDGGACLWV